MRFMNDDVKYVSLTKEELRIEWEKHKRIIEGFLRQNKYEINKFYIDEEAVLSVISKVDQRRDYFHFFHQLEMSEIKEAALICFWYVKLQPICLRSDQNSRIYDSINEKLAVYYMLSTFRALLKENKLSQNRLDTLPKKYINELIYTLTYRDISKEALILLFESIAIFLGIDPYAPEEK